MTERLEGTQAAAEDRECGGQVQDVTERLVREGRTQAAAERLVREGRTQAAAERLVREGRTQDVTERLEDRLREYAGSGAYPFHMPGHKRRPTPLFPGEGNPVSDGVSAGAGLNPLSIDITEIDGFDNLHFPEGILRTEMENAAAFYGVKETFFSVNGSTCALLAAVSAAVKRGGRLLMERGCHISVYHAAELRGLSLSYINAGMCAEAPPAAEGKGQAEQAEAGQAEAPPAAEGQAETGQAEAEQAEAEEKPAAKHAEDVSGTANACGTNMESGVNEPAYDAVIITSPTYEGCVRDVAFWADFAHARGIPLIVDEAHGAHFGRHPYFPASAVTEGADLVIQSVHKTLPAMTQTALLHNVTGHVPSEKIQHFLDIYETSSPSYVLLSSITSTIHQLEDHGNELFGAYAARLKKLRRRLAGLHFLKLAGGEEAVLKSENELPPFRAGTRTDPGKIVILTPDGPGLYDLVRTKYQLQPEMKGPSHVLFMTSAADTDEGFERLARALEEIDGDAEGTIRGSDAAEEIDSGTEGAISGDNVNASEKISFGAEEILSVNSSSEENCLSAQADSMSASDVRQTLTAEKGLTAQAEAADFGYEEIESRMKISEAAEMPQEDVQLEEAAGRISGDFIIMYPPDIPIAVPGEIITDKIIEKIRRLQRRGFVVLGLKDGRIRVLVQNS